MSFENLGTIPYRNQITSLPLSYFAEKWFIAQAKKLKIIAKNPRLETVRSVLKQHLKHKFDRVENCWIQNPDDPTEYLDLILKCDCILTLENKQGKTIRVAVDITLNPYSAKDKKHEIGGINFDNARKALGIDRHWIIVLPKGFFEKLNINNSIIDRVYQAVDSRNKVQVLTVS